MDAVDAIRLVLELDPRLACVVASILVGGFCVWFFWRNGKRGKAIYLTVAVSVAVAVLLASGVHVVWFLNRGLPQRFAENEIGILVAEIRVTSTAVNSRHTLKPFVGL